MILYPQISIIVPVYNVEKYLNECIDSILNQSYTNFELILVNDGSTDDSGKICDEYAINDKRVRVYHKNNGGQSSARNLGIEKSSCEWLCFIDSDDIVHPRMLEYMKKAIDDSNVKLSVCTNIKDKQLPEDFLYLKTYSLEVLEVTEKALIQNNGYLSIFHANPDIDIMWILCTKLIHKDIVKKYPMTEGRIYEDNAIAMAWCHEAGKVAIVNQELYFYRQNPNSTMHSTFSRKKTDYLWALEQQLEYAHNWEYLQLMNQIMNHYLTSCIYMSKKCKNDLNDKEYSKQILLHAKQVAKQYNINNLDNSILLKIQKINEMLYPIYKWWKRKILALQTCIKCI